jgi:hypothetical protein
MTRRLLQIILAIFGTALATSAVPAFAQAQSQTPADTANNTTPKKAKHVYTDADFVPHDEKCAKLTTAKERSDEGCTPLATDKDADDTASPAVADESLVELRARLAKLQEDQKNFLENNKKWEARVPTETDEGHKQMYLNLIETNKTSAERTADEIKTLQIKIARLEKKQAKAAPVAKKKS